MGDMEKPLRGLRRASLDSRTRPEKDRCAFAPILYGPPKRVRSSAPFSLDVASLSSYKAVVGSFTEHFLHPRNELYESSRFHRRVQAPDKSVDVYYAELCKMVKRCVYPSAAVGERSVRD
ncbi:hypothetical protein HPB50_027163 [Hyalomma asiaticum]|uniref:Uncharacterized protein n=1 Tax=Hyalomma asiaticum TaxID=266040 RepID=A0ACB7RTL3_HYAAI|nr:hypothetical protein HPB50_027163 [Hyalomma asiaticum]